MFRISTRFGTLFIFITNYKNHNVSDTEKLGYENKNNHGTITNHTLLCLNLIFHFGVHNEECLNG